MANSSKQKAERLVRKYATGDVSFYDMYGRTPEKHIRKMMRLFHSLYGISWSVSYRDLSRMLYSMGYKKVDDEE